MLIAAGRLGFIPTKRTAQRPVPGLAHPVIANEQNVLVLRRLEEKLLFDAVVNDRCMDPSPLQIPLHGIAVGVHIRQQQAALPGDNRLFGLGIGLQRCPGQQAHRVRERHFLYLYQIVQRIPTADPAGKPMPFAVGYLQTVVFPGAVGIAGNVHQLAGFIRSQIAQ